MSQYRPPRRPVILVILDGVGHNPAHKSNAVVLANTPNLDTLYNTQPLTLLEASGTAVGLPPGQMGNSEVGHMTLGCGTVLRQDLVKINDAVEDGSFYKNTALLDSIRAAKSINRPIHLTGLVSDGGVHSHINHLLALIKLCEREGVAPMLHMITDGRDTSPQCAKNYLPELEQALSAAKGQIATISGRYFAMDRDQRWERVQQAWDVMTQGKGRTATTAKEAIDLAYTSDETDEFIAPTLLKGASTLEKNDHMIFFNFRNDRPRELTQSLAFDDFDGFNKGNFGTINITTMTMYDESYKLPVAFKKEQPLATLAKIISDAGLKQLHCSETEKYPHVTFFFNGGQEAPFPGEDRCLVNSPKVATYDLQPEMSAEEVADNVIDAMNSGEYAFIVVNFPNGDMVGHTGILDAAIKAMEAVDIQCGRIIKCAEENEISLLLTADHGNCDLLVDPITLEPHTQHTTFPVGCSIIDKVPWKLANGFGLAAVAPTILQLMGLEQPTEMQGKSLLLEEIKI